ncbi:MAG: acyl carrier protein [Dysgonamonadaceae bacterium]|jgi:acyl carrier protein|nr:acyl carrier protein [Dysgonamonadaceae bacterium]
MSTTEVKTKIKEIIIKRLNLKISSEDISDEILLFASKENGKGLGLDSIDSLELAVGLMDEFDVTISDEDMHIFESVNTIYDFVTKNK